VDRRVPFPVSPGIDGVEGVAVGVGGEAMSNKIVVPENIKQAALDAEGETLLGTPWQEIALGGALLGRTFTREQANAMKLIIDTAVHG
jgi:hypothetical protein